MKANTNILNTADVIAKLSYIIERNQLKPDFSIFKQFDGDAVYPLMNLMFAAKEVTNHYHPDDIIELLMELVESQLFNPTVLELSAHDTDDYEEVTLNRKKASNLIFTIRKLLVFYTKAFYQLQQFEEATGMVYKSQDK